MVEFLLISKSWRLFTERSTHTHIWYAKFQLVWTIKAHHTYSNWQSKEKQYKSVFPNNQKSDLLSQFVWSWSNHAFLPVTTSRGIAATHSSDLTTSDAKKHFYKLCSKIRMWEEWERYEFRVLRMMSAGNVDVRVFKPFVIFWYDSAFRHHRLIIS